MEIRKVTHEEALGVISLINLLQTTESSSTSLYFSQQGVDTLNSIVAVIDGVTVGWCVEWSNAECHVMVVPSHRRKGIGKALIDTMNEMKSEDSGFCPWDKRSIKFYNTFNNIAIHKNYKYYTL